jgi:predicted DNA-binding ribbon-helix-helix protein
MSKLDDAFATLRNLITDQTRDLAMAMAELRSVAQQRDNLSEALERNCVQYVQKQQALIAERDKLKSELAVTKERMDAQACVLDGCRIQRDAAVIQRDSSWWSLSRAKESLRAAEHDLAETESSNSDLRTVNARLVADLAAATQRADTAEAILRAKA